MCHASSCSLRLCFRNADLARWFFLAWGVGNEYPYQLPRHQQLPRILLLKWAARMRELSQRTDDGPLAGVTKVDHIKGVRTVDTVVLVFTADSLLGHDHGQSPANV